MENKNYKFTKIDKYERIKEILLSCSKCLFNQTLNDEALLCNLANKFYNYGRVLEITCKNYFMGFVAYYCNDKKSGRAFLSMIVVLEKYQGNGIGKEMLQYVIDDCKSYGMNRLYLKVNVENKKAITFYRNKGFTIEDKDGNDYLMYLLL